MAHVVSHELAFSLYFSELYQYKVVSGIADKLKHLHVISGFALHHERDEYFTVESTPAKIMKEKKNVSLYFVVCHSPQFYTLIKYFNK